MNKQNNDSEGAMTQDEFIKDKWLLFSVFLYVVNLIGWTVFIVCKGLA